MNERIQEGRPGLHFEHLRRLVQLRKASGWLGIVALVAALAFYQLHRKDPALFESSGERMAHAGTAVTGPNSIR